MKITIRTLTPLWTGGVDQTCDRLHETKLAVLLEIGVSLLQKGDGFTTSLLYVSIDLIGADESEIRKQALKDLQLVAEGLKEMFLTYGFSAKCTSGYGVAEDEIKNFKVATRAQTPEPKSTRLSQLAQEVIYEHYREIRSASRALRD